MACRSHLIFTNYLPSYTWFFTLASYNANWLSLSCAQNPDRDPMGDELNQNCTVLEVMK